jgi:VanZ family protein
MNKFNHLFLLWLPVLAWMALIFYLSSIPNLKTSPDPQIDRILRKVAHFLFYSIGFFTLFRAINFRQPKPNYWLPFVLAVLYSISDEYHQTFVPTRHGAPTDVLIDSGGAFFGSLLTGIFLVKLNKNLKLQTLLQRYKII